MLHNILISAIDMFFCLRRQPKCLHQQDEDSRPSYRGGYQVQHCHMVVYDIDTKPNFCFPKAFTTGFRALKSGGQAPTIKELFEYVV